jgi:anti-sigma-K factor RskA
VNCDGAAELLGAYALDALPPGEVSAVRSHLATCETHAAEAAALRATAAHLPALAGEAPAPAALRSRIMSAVAATPQDGAAAAPRVGPARADQAVDAAPRAIASAPSRQPWYQRGVPGWTLAAAAAVVVGLLAWNITLVGDGAPTAEELAARATDVRVINPENDRAAGAVIYFGEDERAALIASGVDPISDDETYQIWTLDEDGSPTSAGLVRPSDSGQLTAVFDFAPSESNAFAVTLEPAGGSPQPTTSPLFIVEF